jgi:hypothetical protein
MLNVVCVLKSGEWKPSKLPGGYTVGHVERLQRLVRRHLTVPYEFICLSDIEVPCRRIPLTHDWPGWWAKLELFKLPGPVLYLDLDTDIVGNIDHLTNLEGFVVLRNLSSMKKGRIGSGVMFWSGDLSHLYQDFLADPERFMLDYSKDSHRWGDQGFIQEHAKEWTEWQEIFPNQIRSFKLQKPGPDDRIICYHGKGKPNLLEEK